MARRYPNLNASILLQIHELFRRKNWSIDNDTNINLYQRFCERLSIFEYEEQMLLLKLSDAFEKIPVDQFVENIWSAYYSIPENTLKNASKIIFMPLLPIHKSKRKTETKSSAALHYLLRISDFDWVPYNQKFFFFEDPEDLQKNFDALSLLILIDDFIGSGETAYKAINSYKNLGINLTSSNIVVLSMISQEIGVKDVEKKTGITVYSDKFFRRGISDAFDPDIVAPSLKLMKAMEKKISSEIEKKGWSLGYMQSEALVCLSSKTPNNTFPVFWFETETKLSPFPRYRKFKSPVV